MTQPAPLSTPAPAACSTAVACLALTNPFAGETVNPFPTLTQADESSNVEVLQGYASDGGVQNFFFDNLRILASSTYDALTVTAQSAALPAIYPHIGDGDYAAGKVFAVAENYQGCAAPPSAASIATFDATTLARTALLDITADAHEVSAIAIAPLENMAIVSSFCDGSKLWVYDEATLQLAGTFPLPIPVINIQGLAYRTGILYIIDTNGGVYGLRLNDMKMQKLMQCPMGGEYEGIDFHTAQFRLLINANDGTHRLYSYNAQ